MRRSQVGRAMTKRTCMDACAWVAQAGDEGAAIVGEAAPCRWERRALQNAIPNPTHAHLVIDLDPRASPGLDVLDGGPSLADELAHFPRGDVQDLVRLPPGADRGQGPEETHRVLRDG